MSGPMTLLPKITGEIACRDLSDYQGLIDNYLNKVADIESIHSIIQIGGFSAPGLSDLDLLVVMDDQLNLPSWEQISLKSLSQGLEAQEIIAHDIFVIPKSIADYCEAYFYIERQTNILRGEPVGGRIEFPDVCVLEKILSLEYSVFTIQTMMNLLTRRSVHVREIGLFLGSSKHSAKLAAANGLISTEEMQRYSNSIDLQRQKILEGRAAVSELEVCFEEILELLGLVMFLQSDTLTKKIEKIGQGYIYRAGERTCIVSVKDLKMFRETFIELIDWNKRFPRIGNRFLAIPVARNFISHLKSYIYLSDDLRRYYPEIEGTREYDLEFRRVRRLRIDLVIDHWRFLRRNRFLMASGKAYCGFSMMSSDNVRSFIRSLQARCAIQQLKRKFT